MTAGAVWKVPDPPATSNVRYIDLKNGSDLRSGIGTLSNAWKSFSYAASAMPPDCTLVLKDGDYAGLDFPMHTGQWGYAFPPDVVLRPESHYGARMSGTGQFLTLVGGDGATPRSKNLTVWGFDLHDWGDVYGNGNVDVSGNVEGFSLIGCRGVNPGDGYPIGMDHNCYWSGGVSYARTPRNTLISFCEFGNSVPNSGALIMHSYGSGWLTHDLTIKRCIGYGYGMKWGFLFTAGYSAGSPCNILVDEVDVRMVYNDAMFRFFEDYGGGAPNSGVDPSFVLRNSVLVGLPGSSGPMFVLNSVAGAAHNPTTQNNRFYTATGSIGIALGSGDVIGAPTTDQPTLVYVPGGSEEVPSTARQVLVHPMSAMRRLQVAVAGAAAPNKRAAGLQSLAAAAGAQGMRLRLSQGGADKATRTYSGIPVMNSIGLPVPSTPTTQSPIAALDADAAASMTIEAQNRSWRVPVSMGRSGQAATLSDDLSSTSTLSIAPDAVVLVLDPTLDTSSIPAGAQVIWTGAQYVPLTSVGVHIHRYPTGGDAEPLANYRAVRSHDYAPLFWRNWNPRNNQTDPDPYYWTDVDAWLDYHYSKGHECHLCFHMTPSWASTSGSAYNPLYPGYPGGLQLASNQAYVSTAVLAILTHARDRGTPFKRVEQRNEPSWNPSGVPNADSFVQASASELATEGRTVYQTVKAFDSSIPVGSPGFSYLSGSPRMYLNAPDGSGGFGRDWCDALCGHFYDGYAQASEGATVADKVATMRTEAAAGGLPLNIPIWNTEHGYGGYDSNFRFRNATAAQKGNLLYGAGLMLAAAGVPLTDWYAIGGTTFYLGWDTAQPQISAALGKLSAICGKTLNAVYVDAAGSYGCVVS